MKTTVVNQTKRSFDLKEGNAGAFRMVKQLGGGDNVSFKLDPNATYREYIVASGKQGETLIFSSDDFSEHKVISIEEDENGRIVCKCLARKKRDAPSSGLVAGVEPTRETSYKKLFKWT